MEEDGGFPGPRLPVVRSVNRDEALLEPGSNVSHSAVG